MATSARIKQLTAEHLNAVGAEVPTRKSNAGRPRNEAPEPPPVKTPFPAFVSQPDDDEPSDILSAYDGRPLTKGQVRAWRWYIAEGEHACQYINRLWAWKQRMGMTKK